MSIGEAIASPAGATASPGYRRYVIWLLFSVALINFFDRQIINILAEPIKRDLGLADWQLGLLTGFSFAALYTFSGIPIALLADRTNRARIISGALLFWSVFTAACGLAQTFTQLLLARLAVGLGESGCQPPSLSLISDYAPKEERSSALAHYSLGITIGGLLALVAGGILADQFGWRTAFLVAGAPGVLLGILSFMTLKDPRRGQAGQDSLSVRATMGELGRTKIIWWIYGASAAKGMISYGQVAFLGSFLLRVHGDSLTDASNKLSAATGGDFGPLVLVGGALGLISAVGGVTGTWLGGQFGDRIMKDRPEKLLLLPAIATPLAVPFQVAAFLSPSGWLAVALLIPPALLHAMWLGPTFAALQSVVKPRVRSTASAVQATFVLLIGLGFGPVVVGALSDFLAGPLGLGSADGVRWALIALCSVSFVASWLFYVAAGKLKASIIS
ncbi:spinster family MFS transporter [Phenylobacterium sp. VNQ135]|uniref:spinster family MFS transporter n=1 Tax=Phenylobacterium sp. VNQ135 TaxID=3400922 RepID=UPI003C086973